MLTKKVAIGCDHAGFPYKDEIIFHLKNKGFEIEDFGTYSLESVDYPDYVHPLAQSIESEKNEIGILICGSGNGVAITANKHKNIRAAVVWQNEIATLARAHNNANIICIPSRFISLDEAKQFIDTFLKTDFEGGRHKKRVEKISEND